MRHAGPDALRAIRGLEGQSRARPGDLRGDAPPPARQRHPPAPQRPRQKLPPSPPVRYIARLRQATVLPAPTSLMRRLPVVSVIVLCSACAPSPRPTRAPGGDTLGLEQPRLPTGVRLDPAGTQYDLRAAMPLTMLLAPGGRSFVISSAGYRAPGLDVVDRNTGAVTQSLPQAAAFLGVAFTPDGSALFASGADQDVVYRYTWAGDGATPADSIVLAPKAPDSAGTRYPAGLTVSPDGARLYVAENVADSLA